MGNITLPPSTVSLYSIASDGLSEDRYGDVDFLARALTVFEGAEFSEGHCTIAFGVDSVLRCVLALFSLNIL